MCILVKRLVREKPEALTVPSSVTQISAAIRSWESGTDNQLEYIGPDNPEQNAQVERFNRTERSEWLL